MVFTSCYISKIISEKQEKNNEKYYSIYATNIKK